MTIDLTIPESQKRALAKLVSLRPEQRRALREAVSAARPRLLIQDFIAGIAPSAVLPEKDLLAVIEMLSSLYIELDRHGITSHEIAKQVSDLAQAESSPDLQPADGNWKSFADDLAGLLSLGGTLGVTSKANEIKLAHERVFCDARILTDLRPVYQTNVEDGPAAGIIVHTLKVTYHERLTGHEGNPSTEDFYVALDKEDISRLSELMTRALRKEESLKKIARERDLDVLET